MVLRERLDSLDGSPIVVALARDFSDLSGFLVFVSQVDQVELAGLCLSRRDLWHQ